MMELKLRWEAGSFLPERSGSVAPSPNSLLHGPLSNRRRHLAVDFRRQPHHRRSVPASVATTLTSPTSRLSPILPNTKPIHRLTSPPSHHNHTL
jgi:hypothetical protein